ncbi:hypothetical protein EIP91_000355 [Steccherinum ochraceum]|uniref:F-box domain-containing protein n=1 Tax=Steccherinum ochraceum TaxID=92696 RepID=A0A4R0RIC9_9APHY|nr:hypothetical protein EIP91_000355 [Steccherinum ochraceum]
MISVVHLSRAKIPVDIWSAIFEAIPGATALYAQTTQAIQSLVACCLTCRAWRAPSTKVLKKFKPQSQVILRTKADLAALPLTRSYCSIITSLRICPSSLTDQGWITAALLRILLRSTAKITSIHLENVNLAAQHPDFFKAWSLVHRRKTRLSITVGRIFNARYTHLVYLFRSYDVHFSSCPAVAVEDSTRMNTVPTTWDARHYNFGGCQFRFCCPRHCDGTPFFHRVQLDDQWRCLGPLLALHPHLGQNIQELRFSAMDSEMNPYITFDHDLFVPLLHNLSSLHKLTIDNGRVVPPEDISLWPRKSAGGKHIHTLVLEGPTLITQRGMAWLCTVLTFPTLILTGVSNTTRTSSSDPDQSDTFPIPRLNALNTLTITDPNVWRRSGSGLRLATLHNPTNITSFSLQLPLTRLHELQPELNALLRSTGERLRHLGLTVESRIRTGQLEGRPRDDPLPEEVKAMVDSFSVIALCPHLDTLSFSLKIPGETLKQEAASQWLYTNLADCPSTLRRLDLKLAVYDVNSADSLVFSLDWARVEDLLLSLENLECVVLHFTPEWGGTVARNQEQLQAFVVEKLPTLHRRGVLRFSEGGST